MFLKIVQKHAKQNTPNFSRMDIFKIVQNEKAGPVSCKKTRVTIMVRRLFVKNQFGCINFFERNF